MSQLQGSSIALNNSSSGYWPGHVVAECLMDDNDSTAASRLATNGTPNSELLSKLKPGSAFSGIISSMVPLDILSTILNHTDHEAADFVYDEFGFKIEHDELCLNNNTFSEPNQNEELHKLKWIAYLEFTLNSDIGQSFSWDEVTALNRCDKLRLMIRGQGVPHSLRQFMWMRLSGALDKKLNAQFKYSELIRSHTHDQYHTSKQIEKDLLRTLPTNACFSQLSSAGVPRLRRVLQSIAWLYPNVGYCQGMGTIAATLLLLLEEEDTFWLMSAIIEDMLPASYYSHTLLGVQVDIKVLRHLVAMDLPEIEQAFVQHDIELSLICINWFLTIFSNVFPMKILLRIWDLFFYEGSVAVFQISLALFKLSESRILRAESGAEIFQILSDIPSGVCDIDLLIETSIRVASSVNREQLDAIRRKHQSYLMAQQGSIINPSHYQNLLLSKEKPRLRTLEGRSNNVLTLFRKLSKPNEVSSQCGESGKKCNEKNILQTEFLVNLREIILKIAHHFQTKDPKVYLNNCNLVADYSIESHSKDLDNYMRTSTVRQFKRAKALLNFEVTEEDELAFQKNDIITILSTKDDHCWVGELNMKKGWFPSRFGRLNF